MEFPELSSDDFNRKYSDTIIRIDDCPMQVGMVVEDEEDVFVLHGHIYEGGMWQIFESSWEDIASFNPAIPTLGWINVPGLNRAYYLSRRMARQWRRGFCSDNISGVHEDYINDGTFIKELFKPRTFFTFQEALELISNEWDPVAVSSKMAIGKVNKKTVLIYKGISVGVYVDNKLMLMPSASYLIPLIPDNAEVELYAP